MVRGAASIVGVPEVSSASGMTCRATTPIPAAAGSAGTTVIGADAAAWIWFT
jgi:hypothetical protein